MITFQQVARLYHRDTLALAAKAVAKHGHHGKGDAFGARYLMACSAPYVRDCVARELDASRGYHNVAVQRLLCSLNSALS